MPHQPAAQRHTVLGHLTWGQAASRSGGKWGPTGWGVGQAGGFRVGHMIARLRLVSMHVHRL